MAKKKDQAAAETAGTETQAEAKAPKAEKPAKIVQNNVTRPNAGTTTGRIWEISDSISAKLKAPAPRKDVMEAAAAEGINAATAATQYGKWRKFNGLKSEPKAPKAEAPAAPAATAAAVE